MTKNAKWVSVEERLPEITKDNPYPICLVWRECITQGSVLKGFGSMHLGELRLLGGDKYRHYWVSTTGKEKERYLAPLENSTWKVTYWMELPSPPYKKT